MIKEKANDVADLSANNRVVHICWFWGQGHIIIKAKLLVLILSTSGANARKSSKSSNRNLWESFCRLLEPRPESHGINASGADFVDFWSQGQNFSKSELPGLILLTSGAKAMKLSKHPVALSKYNEHDLWDPLVKFKCHCYSTLRNDYQTYL